ncbi:threonyl-tRNA synthetase [Caldisphaera lagunensis DSM 15908]|uniref:Threonine--tRNA ligase catalytic subunit n=1 Tax=Caldisphaera lagunensis (strain DSM 15908 / JCM 11604 / ANMR 0165 / IC-154) TaxID=1056495 RepID=L0AAP4_CALLD|nr:aminoacyl--tRNA ligase-related protein [Caldisphaera lagunensis]AFZ70956.1 threonyl-tRNA synthetase [Caldisphaera lagunensis DSM 15908]
MSEKIEKNHMDYAHDLDIAIKPETNVPKLDREYGYYIGLGIPLFSIGGGYLRASLYQILTNFHARRGYYIAETPVISSAALFDVSGHLGYYKQNMYVFHLEDRDYAVKPMNCPFHLMIFLNELGKYRNKIQLPFKIFELGRVHRLENSGSVYGLLRARAFTQDDAHIITFEKDAVKVITDVFEEMITIYSNLFRIKVSPETIKIRLSVSDRSKIGTEFMGTLEEWERAEEFLEKAAKKIDEEYGISFIKGIGEAAFYGPKIDVIVKMEDNKEWQLGTIQFDFNLARRFKIYDMVKEVFGDINVYVIHRALLGSIERFLGVYLENYKGRLPFSISPLQFAVLAIKAGDESDSKVEDVAKGLHKELIKNGFRSGYKETSRTSLSGDVRLIETTAKPPIIIYVGKKEVESNMITVSIFYQKRVEKKVELNKINEKIEEIVNDLEKDVISIAGEIPKIPGDLSYLI